MLSWAAGFVDAVCYVALLHVFVANMTGNTIASGIGLAEGNWSLIWRRGLAIPAFVVGMAASRLWMRLASRRRATERAASAAYALEAALLLAFIWLGSAQLEHGEVRIDSGAVFYVLVVLPAFAMGLQNAALSHFGPLSVRTTHVTGTLAKFVDEAVRWLLREGGRGTGGRALLFFGAWLLYFIGAFLGVWLKLRWELNALYFPVGALAVVIALTYSRRTPAAGGKGTVRG